MGRGPCGAVAIEYDSVSAFGIPDINGAASLDRTLDLTVGARIAVTRRQTRKR